MQLCFLRSLLLFRGLKFRARQAYSEIREMYIPRKLPRIRYYIFKVTCPTLLVSYVRICHAWWSLPDTISWRRNESEPLSKYSLERSHGSHERGHGSHDP